MKEFDERIRELLKDQNHVIQGEGDRQLQDWDEYTEDPDQEFVDDFDRPVSDERISEEDLDFTPDTFHDTYINKQQIVLPRGAGDSENVHYVRVTKPLRDVDGRPIIGMANKKPMLDTREYEVEFMDGHSEALAANLIVQNLYSQIDEVGTTDI